MKGVKRFLTVLALAAVLGMPGLKAFAGEIDVVDLDKVVSSYTKAQDVSADLKVKEADLQKFLADAQKQLKDAKTPVDKKNLEDRLTLEFKTKTDDFRDLQVKQWKQIEDDVFNTIDKVSKARKADLVLNKSSVLQGGVDITDQILSILNTTKK